MVADHFDTALLAFYGLQFAHGVYPCLINVSRLALVYSRFFAFICCTLGQSGRWNFFEFLLMTYCVDVFCPELGVLL